MALTHVLEVDALKAMGPEEVAEHLAELEAKIKEQFSDDSRGLKAKLDAMYQQQVQILEEGRYCRMLGVNHVNPSDDENKKIRYAAALIVFENYSFPL